MSSEVWEQDLVAALCAAGVAAGMRGPGTLRWLGGNDYEISALAPTPGRRSRIKLRIANGSRGKPIARAVAYWPQAANTGNRAAQLATNYAAGQAVEQVFDYGVDQSQQQQQNGQQQTGP